MRLILVIFSSFFMVKSLAQQVLQHNSGSTTMVLGSMSIESDNTKEVKGSPYYLSDFIYADIANATKPYRMRYNVYLDEMEYEIDGVLYNLDREQHDIVNFKEIQKKYVVKNYKGNKSFFIELVDGKNYSLYKKEHIVFKEATEAKTSFDIPTPATYKQEKDEFFIQSKEGELISIPRSKRKFLEFLNESEVKSVDNFIKKNKISLNEERDLIILFGHLNQLN